MYKRTHLSQALNPDEHSSAGQRIGYARVSSIGQNLDRQTEQLTNAGATKIFTDTTTGSSIDRPGLHQALDYLRDGDTLIITSMDRLARSLIDLNNLVEQLTSNSIHVQFLREAQTYTTDANPMSQLMLGILGSVAQFERAIIRERQAEGIARAKARGVYTGRKPALNPAQIKQAQQWVNQGIPKAEIARRLHIGRTTLYKYLGSQGH